MPTLPQPICRSINRLLAGPLERRLWWMNKVSGRLAGLFVDMAWGEAT